MFGLGDTEISSRDRFVAPSTSNSPQRTPSRNEASRARRSHLFSEEKARQASLMPRLEKIRVEYSGAPEAASLVLNKGVSTPFHVAQRE